MNPIILSCGDHLLKNTKVLTCTVSSEALAQKSRQARWIEESKIVILS
ncbi:MAG: hypothetical protein ACE5D1_00600 [Fidelibacterota bacterium]